MTQPPHILPPHILIVDDHREIRDALVTARGSWKALSLVVGLSVSLGAAAAKLFPFLLAPGN